MGLIIDTEYEVSRGPGKDCGDFEILISKACDGECAEEELICLREHLRGCASCRALMKEYRDLSVLMAARSAALKCPELPAAAKGKNRSVIYRYMKYAVQAAACIAFFIFGHYAGFYHAGSVIVKMSSPAAVTTPSMWAAQRPESLLFVSSGGAEQPFTDGIGRYRLAIGEEMRKDNVDWMKVRELVEAMGELRTDLELLTIHMAYLDIRTGSSPYEVAEHWESLGRSSRAVFRP